MTTMTAPELRLQRYREDHRIETELRESTIGLISVCRHDGIRVRPYGPPHLKQLRHDLKEIADLTKARAGVWPR